MEEQAEQAAPEYPDHFPGAWQHFPVDVKRYLTARLLARCLEIHDGPADLIKWLYAGTERPDGQRLSYLTGGAECWAWVVEDTRAWVVEDTRAWMVRRAGKLSVSGTL